jgi:cell division protease FtsH
MEQRRKQQFTFSGIYILIALAILWFVQSLVLQAPQPRPVPYSEFLAVLRAGRVERVQIGEDRIVAELRAGAEPRPANQPGTDDAAVTTSRLPGIDESALLDELERRDIEFAGKIDRVPWWQSMLGWMLPFFLLLFVWMAVVRRIGGRGGALSFGRSRAKIYDRSGGARVTFDDVAGVDEAEAELREIVGFLAEPGKYSALGARIPKGVLLVGAPGTGKTLLARAVAGEADVPFFSLSGSEFVEMFVGVGAARMRDLFEQAKGRAPCIVFIDELDAIGKSRGGIGTVATHDEREQTLNQLLVEMDGFDAGKGVIIMAATNRPEVLDPALLRAGRFDRQVLVDRPDLRGRREILAVHTRTMKLAPAVDLHEVAKRTPGMVGADLANVVNEAALNAGRRSAEEIEPVDFEEAIDRIQLGLKKKGRVMQPDEKRRVAYHESGHALVALSVQHADPVHRVTIIPRSVGSLGATLQLPTEERYLMTRDELNDRICVMMGGRVAEELALDDISTGAQNDLERATETARQMVCRFGMSEKLGSVTFGRAAGGHSFELPLGWGEERGFSEETARAIDAEVRDIVESARARARRLLEERRPVLERLAALLLDKETLERQDLDAVLAEAPRADRRIRSIGRRAR